MHIQLKWVVLHALLVSACMAVGSVIMTSVVGSGVLNPANLITNDQSAFGYLGAVFITVVVGVLGGVIGFAVSAYYTETYRGRHLFAVAVLVLVVRIVMLLFTTDFFNPQTFEVSDFIAVFGIIPSISLPIVISLLFGWVVGSVARKLFKREKLISAR